MLFSYLSYSGYGLPNFSLEHLYDPSPVKYNLCILNFFLKISVFKYHIYSV